MGKSPGKWIKGILFGKKTSKSNLSKGRELSRSASERPARVSCREPISASKDDTPLISDPVPSTVLDRIDNSSFDKGDPAILASDGLVSSSSKKGGARPSDPEIPNDPEKIRLEQAATVVQASFRSYLARRAFQTLKGIVRLQATVRGCLVRRQAVATLFCMQAIVKLQAITRGYIVRQSGIGNGQCRKQCVIAKDANNKDTSETKFKPADTLLKNPFVYALLSSSPTAMPLHIQYSSGEPNSAWCWLLRWSISQIWAPNSKQKETGNLKLQPVETAQIKPKREGRRALSATVRNDPNHADSEMEKLKHKGRKFSSPSVKSSQENQQSDEVKIKRGLKKIQKPSGEVSKVAEIDIGKTKRFSKKLSVSPVPKFSKRTSNTPTENLAESAEHNDVESSLELSGANSPANQLTPESMTRVPSYMAKTASSKAKVKVQVSPRFGQDAVDKNGLTRRHSLPPSLNGKLMSSPRLNGLVQANGREGNKTDRSLSSSRDITEEIHAEWKR